MGPFPVRCPSYWGTRPLAWWTLWVPGSKASAIDILMLNPMVVPITMIRNGISGMPMPIGTGHIVYSVAFCLLSVVIGAMVFKRYEARVIKKL